MFARIEVSLKPEFQDPVATPLLRRMEMTDPHLRKLVRWARSLDVFWLDLPLAREELIYAANEVLWDPVLHWLFTGNLIPSAAGKKGGVEDLLETAPNRPGRFFAIEKRFRLGVTDHPARTLIEAFEAVLKRKLDDARVASGSMLVLEGPTLSEEQLSRIAREYYSNELLESWTLLSEKEISHSERFHPERVRREMPKAPQPRFTAPIDHVPLPTMAMTELQAYSKRRGYQFAEGELSALKDYFKDVENRDATDAEIEIFSRVWGDHSSQRFARSEFAYSTTSSTELGKEIPAAVHNPVRSTFIDTAREIPRSWVITAFDDQPSLLAFDDDEAISVENEIESRSVASDAKHGAMMGVGEAVLRSAVASRGARPVAATNIIFAPDLYSVPAGSSDALHPRRVLDGVKQGISAAGSHLGVPVVGGALFIDAKEGVTPVLHLSSISMLPRVTREMPAEAREVSPGDLLIVAGTKVGKDGVLGAPAVQVVDTLMQRRLMDFAIETRELGLTRIIDEIGEGGLAWVFYRAASDFGGVEVDLDEVPLKQPGLRPLDILGSESLERLLLIVTPAMKDQVLALAARRGIEAKAIGRLTETKRLEVLFDREKIVNLDAAFLREGMPKPERKATWSGPKPTRPREYGDFAKEGIEVLLRLLSHPNICSREWLVRSLDHEVQGTSAMKPLHTVAYSTDVTQSGPNDASILKPKPQSNSGLVVSTGLAPRLGAVDPYLMGQAVVDEAVRNAISAGADYGKEETLFALNYQFSWPEKEMDDPALAGAMIRAAYGARKAALELQTPFISGIEKGLSGTASRMHFAVQSLSKVGKLGGVKSADFKTPGDAIYILGPAQFGLHGSQLAELQGLPHDSTMPQPDWDTARRLYSWLGGAIGKEQKKLRSMHDISDGGLLVAMAECLIARGLGATLQFPDGLARTNEWEFLLGEGFHSFVASVPELDAPLVEAELTQNDIPFVKLGNVTGAGVLQVKRGETPILAIETKVLRQAWKKEGYWE